MDLAACSSVGLDAALVRAWASAAVLRLGELAPRIDALNVFPVADADTGTNVVHTVTGGLADLSATPTDDVGAAVARLAAGARRQARGSSGMILAGWLTGLADGLAGTTGSPSPRLAGALAAAAAGARAAVAEPWPGTVLEVAEQVARAVDPRAPLADLLPGPLDQVRDALELTSARHPVLRAAGVVDAGACALLVVLEVLAALLAGRPYAQAGDWLPPAVPMVHRPQPDQAFEVMLDVTVAVDRAVLAATGTAAVVTGVGDRWRTHVHTDDPSGALAVVAHDELRVGLVRATTRRGTGPVVVTADAGLVAWFAAAGAVVVIPGGAAQDLPAAVAATGGAPVLATDPRLARAAGASVADPVRAAVACAALDETDGVARALDRVRTADTDDPDPAVAVAALLASAPAEVLTAVPRTGLDPGAARALARTYGLELVLVGPATTGPAWRLGVD